MLRDRPHGLRGLSAVVPAWQAHVGPALDNSDEGFVYRAKEDYYSTSALAPEYACVYYMDRRKKYPFYTDLEVGAPLLQQLLSDNLLLLDRNERLMEEHAGKGNSVGVEVERMKAEGQVRFFDTWLTRANAMHFGFAFAACVYSILTYVCFDSQSMLINQL